MTRIAIPPLAHQAAINATNDAQRLANALAGSSTFESLCLAESARNRAMDALRSLGPQIRTAKSTARAAERAARVDRKIVERDRRYVAALEIPA